ALHLFTGTSVNPRMPVWVASIKLVTMLEQLSANIRSTPYGWFRKKHTLTHKCQPALHIGTGRGQA
ncbi:MAG: hypothetical protein ACR2O8_14315, partial [Rhizobiaceae bacterium]